MGKITVSEANNSLRAFLKGSVLFTDVKKPNGLLAFDRMDNSVLEDVIIESLAMNYATNQEGVINVNLFVPNLSLTFNPPTGTVVDKSQRNNKRLVELERLMMNVFAPVKESDDAIYFNGYNFTYQQASIFPDPASFCCYLNVRIEFNAITI